MKSRSAKHLLTVTLITSLLILCTAVSALEFKSAAWKEYFSTEGLGIMPEGAPIGKGAVGLYSGNGFWPKSPNGDMVSIVDPYDMSGDPALVFSNFAASTKHTYAGDTQKQFLAAMADEFKKFDGTKGLRLPIAQLSCKVEEVPMPNETAGTEVVFGWFAKTDAPEAPSWKYSDKTNTLREETYSNLIDRWNYRFKRYNELVKGRQAEFMSMNAIDLRKTLNAISKQANSEYSDIRKSQAETEKRKAEQTRNQEIINKQREIRKQARADVIKTSPNTADEERRALIDNETDKRMLELYGAEYQDIRDVQKMTQMRSSMRQQVVIDLASQLKDLDKKAQNKLIDKELDRRMSDLYGDAYTPKAHKSSANTDLENQIKSEFADELSRMNNTEQKQFIQNKKALHTGTQKEIDSKLMWRLLAAAVQQSKAEISAIHMSHAVYTYLMGTADQANLPQQTINAVTHLIKQVNRPPNGAFTVVLGCSVRDRFLGCPNHTPKANEIVNRISENMMIRAEKSSDDARIKMIDYVYRSEPTLSESTADTWQKIKKTSNFNKDTNIKVQQLISWSK